VSDASARLLARMASSISGNDKEHRGIHHVGSDMLDIMSDSPTYKSNKQVSWVDGFANNARAAKDQAALEERDDNPLSGKLIHLNMSGRKKKQKQQQQRQPQQQQRQRKPRQPSQPPQQTRRGSQRLFQSSRGGRTSPSTAGASSSSSSSYSMASHDKSSHYGDGGCGILEEGLVADDGDRTIGSNEMFQEGGCVIVDAGRELQDHTFKPINLLPEWEARTKGDSIVDSVANVTHNSRSTIAPLMNLFLPVPDEERDPNEDRALVAANSRSEAKANSRFAKKKEQRDEAEENAEYEDEPSTEGRQDSWSRGGSSSASETRDGASYYSGSRDGASASYNSGSRNGASSSYGSSKNGSTAYTPVTRDSVSRNSGGRTDAWTGGGTTVHTTGTKDGSTAYSKDSRGGSTRYSAGSRHDASTYNDTLPRADDASRASIQKNTTAMASLGNIFSSREESTQDSRTFTKGGSWGVTTAGDSGTFLTGPPRDDRSRTSRGSASVDRNDETTLGRSVSIEVDQSTMADIEVVTMDDMTNMEMSIFNRPPVIVDDDKTRDANYDDDDETRASSRYGPSVMSESRFGDMTSPTPSYVTDAARTMTTQTVVSDKGMFCHWNPLNFLGDAKSVDESTMERSTDWAGAWESMPTAISEEPTEYTDEDGTLPTMPTTIPLPPPPPAPEPVPEPEVVPVAEKKSALKKVKRAFGRLHCGSSKKEKKERKQKSLDLWGV